MPRALVTGASGFVGPHLLAALQNAGHDAVATDRMPPRLAAATFHTCDLGDAASVAALVSAVQPLWIFHLASQSSVARSFEAPQETLLGNLGAACNLLEAVRHCAPKARLLMVGSAEQYGSVAESELPIAETHPFRPASPYAVSKAAQELLALQYAAAFGIDVVLARSFNHSGPGQSDRFVLPGFARQIALAELGRLEPVLRVGNLEVWRDFLDVRDVVRAYVQLLERGATGEAYNVCSGEAQRVRDLLDGLLARARIAMRVEVDSARWRAADLPILRGDPAKLGAATSWKPALSTAAMLEAVLEDWRARVAAGAGV